MSSGWEFETVDFCLFGLVLLARLTVNDAVKGVHFESLTAIVGPPNMYEASTNIFWTVHEFSVRAEQVYV